MGMQTDLVLSLDKIEELVRDIKKEFNRKDIKHDEINICEIILSVNHLRKDIRKYERRIKLKHSKR